MRRQKGRRMDVLFSLSAASVVCHPASPTRKWPERKLARCIRSVCWIIMYSGDYACTAATNASLSGLTDGCRMSLPTPQADAAAEAAAFLKEDSGAKLVTSAAAGHIHSCSLTLPVLHQIGTCT